jgi:hypothetical protein
MPTSSKKVIMRVRDRLSNSPWALDNFEGGGWKVRNAENTAWVRMSPINTRISNPEHDADVHDPEDTNFPKWLEPIVREDT